MRHLQLVKPNKINTRMVQELEYYTDLARNGQVREYAITMISMTGRTFSTSIQTHNNKRWSLGLIGAVTKLLHRIAK